MRSTIIAECNGTNQNDWSCIWDELEKKIQRCVKSKSVSDKWVRGVAANHRAAYKPLARLQVQASTECTIVCMIVVCKSPKMQEGLTIYSSLRICKLVLMVQSKTKMTFQSYMHVTPLKMQWTVLMMQFKNQILCLTVKGFWDVWGRWEREQSWDGNVNFYHVFEL